MIPVEKQDESLNEAPKHDLAENVGDNTTLPVLPDPLLKGASPFLHQPTWSKELGVLTSLAATYTFVSRHCAEGAFRGRCYACANW